MSLLIGHGSVGIAVWACLDKDYHPLRDHDKTAAAIALSLIPDLDYLLHWPLGFDLDATHRTVTHSLLFAVAMGVALSRWGRLCRISRRGLAAVLFSAVIFFHALTDLATTSNEFPAIPGVPLWWPLSQDPIVLPYSPLPRLYVHPPNDTLEGIAVMDFLHLCFEDTWREAVGFGPILALLLLWRHRLLESRLAVAATATPDRT